MADHREVEQHKTTIAGYAQRPESDTNAETEINGANGVGSKQELRAVLCQAVSESMRDSFGSYCTEHNDLMTRIDTIWELLQEMDRRLFAVFPSDCKSTSRSSSKRSMKNTHPSGRPQYSASPAKACSNKELDPNSNAVIPAVSCKQSVADRSQATALDDLYPALDSSSDSSSLRSLTHLSSGSHGLSKSSLMARRASKTSLCSTVSRCISHQTIDNLDAMLTDHLLQSEGFTRKTTSHSGQKKDSGKTSSICSGPGKEIKSKEAKSKRHLLEGLVRSTFSLNKVEVSHGSLPKSEKVVIQSATLGLKADLFDLRVKPREVDADRENMVPKLQNADDHHHNLAPCNLSISTSQFSDSSIRHKKTSANGPDSSVSDSSIRHKRLSALGSQKRSSGRMWGRSSTGTGAWESSLDDLRAEHESKLVSTFQDLVSNDGDMVTARGSLSSFVLRSQSQGWPIWVLVACGILPVNEGFEGWAVVYFVMLLLMAVFGHSVVLTYANIDGLYAHISTAFFAIGCLVGLLCLRMMKIENLLGPHNRVLETYAKNFDSLKEWRTASFRRLIFGMILGAGMVCSRVVIFAAGCPVALGGGGTDESFTGVLGFAFVSVLMVSLTFCKLHVCCALEMFVDKFCYRFFEDRDIGKGIDEWNVLQALLRRSAATLDACFLAFGTSVLAVLLLIGMGLFHGDRGLQVSESNAHCRILWCGWLSPPVIMVIYVTFKSATITEKCRRVPALVNSWTFEDALKIDHDKQYVVAYIEHSAAGFYIKGMRLSTIMALKLSYCFGVVMFTLITQALVQGR